MPQEKHMQDQLKIIIAAHKSYWLPTDAVYLPLQVGAVLHPKLGYTPDDTGENISAKNPYYCELTGIYWAWKNLHADYVGLCHYRRYFGQGVHTRDLEKKKAAIFQSSDYKKLLKKYDIIVPAKRHYYIETVRSQYEHAHYKDDLDKAEQIIIQKYPDYHEAFTRVMQRRSLYLYNMFVMPWLLFDQYCTWLFDILFALEPYVTTKNYDTYEARVFGFLGERLFNVWLENQRVKIAEIPVINLEPVNWPRKIEQFLKRKFIGR